MIDDLRNDSARWEQDRQNREARGQGTGTYFYDDLNASKSRSPNWGPDYPAGVYRDQHQRPEQGYPPSGQPYPPEHAG